MVRIAALGDLSVVASLVRIDALVHEGEQGLAVLEAAIGEGEIHGRTVDLKLRQHLVGWRRVRPPASWRLTDEELAQGRGRRAPRRSRARTRSRCSASSAASS